MDTRFLDNMLMKTRPVQNAQMYQGRPTNPEGDWFRMMQRPEWQEWFRRLRSGGDTSYMMPKGPLFGAPGGLPYQALLGRFSTGSTQPQDIAANKLHYAQLQQNRMNFQRHQAPTAGSAQMGPYRPKF